MRSAGGGNETQESLNLGARSLLCCCLLVQQGCASLWFLATKDTAQINPVLLIRSVRRCLKTLEEGPDAFMSCMQRWPPSKPGGNPAPGRTDSMEKAPALPCSCHLPTGDDLAALGGDFLNGGC